MTDIHLPKYDSTRDQIRQMKENGIDWPKIEDTYKTLKTVGTLSEYISQDIWREIVKEEESEYEKRKNIEKSKGDTSIISKDEDNDTFVPKGERSSWQLYRKGLLENGWREEAVNGVEKSTLSLLKKLNRDTTESGPKKGLVIGQVQSGKTASMAGLIAMAADWGWNTFIVLSGMIENLREQTQNRLINDLNSPGNNNWRSMHRLSRHSEPGDRTQNLDFTDSSSQKYLNVCLKNKTRLENLVGWLEQDTNKLKQMKILVIDDEADQGSINTKNFDKDERAKINELVINLVEVGSQSYRPKSMNYISYTATPYSNFLNESAPESLYPKDFIGMLPVAKEYFGPKQIFGKEETEEPERLDIVRKISQNDLDYIKDQLHNGEDQNIPQSLAESISWFFCASAVMRYFNYKKPLSMLVHTSQLQAHHSNMSEAISKWINDIPHKDLIKTCRKIFENEKDRFSLSQFRNSFKEYPIPDEQLNDYPKFDDIKHHIMELKERISHIKMNESGDLNYHRGIHLCVDNSANNGINDENAHVRLAYPSKEKLKGLDRAPAFIVVGGSTLSRGLTIEGLVSTYFLRAATAGDSLMQMGRWFGYRKGYELMPRIWVTEKTFEQFQFLTSLEEELREEIEQFALGHKSPSDYGPRVKNSPKVSWLRVTAKNKMQSAEKVDMDFTGASIQTIHFDNDEKILQNNLNTADDFLLNHCGTPQKSVTGNSVIYRGVKFEDIERELLLKMMFNQRSVVFNQIEIFCDWFRKVQNEIGFKDWNVIVAGAGTVADGEPTSKNQWYVPPYSVGKVNRSAKSSSMNYNKNIANIGVLRGPNDLFADIEDKSILENGFNGKSTNSHIQEIRDKADLGDVPQLIIYRIKKDSTARESSNKNGSASRVDLNFDDDIIGIYINVPGDSSNRPHAKGLVIKINSDEEIGE
ncbi:Z1 domain-containing protein [Virgibacillus sp. L01]|uniref:Z1 domain-containing protein n=1 Tax=Virgibacillus sp. L01 TaxID=3457429 RepID=UPI003FD5A0E6